ncbi:MAG: hypothetical protein J0I20_24400 [Chloroflexi bacterium]|nr:hypothetical protein [Chloroflexota bacterium]
MEIYVLTMRLSELPPKSSRNPPPPKGWVSFLITLVLLGLLGGALYFFATGFTSKVYPAGTTIDFNNFQVEVLQVVYRPDKPVGDLLFCNSGLVEVEVSLKVTSLRWFSGSENVRPSQFSLYNARTDRLYIQPTSDKVHQPIFKGGALGEGDTEQGWLTFCPFEEPQNLQLRFLPQRPEKGTFPLKIDLAPVVKTG